MFYNSREKEDGGKEVVRTNKHVVSIENTKVSTG